jgi:hypothetical protein
MGQFVSEDRVEFGGVPVTPIGGKKNGRSERAHGDRNGDKVGFRDAGKGVAIESSPYERVVDDL